MERKPLDINASFNIDKVSFENVNSRFEKEFRDSYQHSLGAMSDAKDPMTNASGANTLGILEKMALNMSQYNTSSDFKESYQALIKEYEPFAET